MSTFPCGNMYMFSVWSCTFCFCSSCPFPRFVPLLLFPFSICLYTLLCFSRGMWCCGRKWGCFCSLKKLLSRSKLNVFMMSFRNFSSSFWLTFFINSNRPSSKALSMFWCALFCCIWWGTAFCACCFWFFMASCFPRSLWCCRWVVWLCSPEKSVFSRFECSAFKMSFFRLSSSFLLTFFINSKRRISRAPPSFLVKFSSVLEENLILWVCLRIFESLSFNWSSLCLLAVFHPL